MKIIFFFSYKLLLLLCVIGHSFSKESDIELVPCQEIQDCYTHMGAIACDATIVSCYEGYCVCNHKQ